MQYLVRYERPAADGLPSGDVEWHARREARPSSMLGLDYAANRI